MHSMQQRRAWKMRSLSVRGTILPSEVTWLACLSFLKLVPALKEATHSQSVVEQAYKDWHLYLDSQIMSQLSQYKHLL